MASRSLLCVALAFACMISPARAQTSESTSRERLSALIKEVRAQQKELAGNQAKIDEKLAALAESIRLARIYASRGGR